MTVYIQLKKKKTSTTERGIDMVTINAFVHIIKRICDMNLLTSTMSK